MFQRAIFVYMAGHPKTHAFRGELVRRTIAELPDKPEATTLDYVCWRLANGETLRAIAASFRVSPRLVIDVLDADHGADARRDRFAQARELGAHQLVDEAIAISDAASPGDANVARLRVATRQWVAERWNRREFGTDKGATVNVTVGALMLDALRAPSAIASAIVDQADVLSIEPATTSAIEDRSTNTTGEPARLEAGASEPGADFSAG